MPPVLPSHLPKIEDDGWSGSNAKLQRLAGDRGWLKRFTVWCSLADGIGGFRTLGVRHTFSRWPGRGRDNIGPTGDGLDA